ncbi:50S ribosomal protein L4 [Ichthyobacterium seriolicida]|uniref:Large ribosomal subunit protein uL4 n=1 Tax=Ichthyobacterium seriolicida TaxID=242600 RepID=A0A1J1DY77_9FLAO|nr:50S ribosomal protein L4 [Ichthyobacterium seriolicida]BAV94809.1 50S ribosomal protein L4 [Ichthyobacterium seriolicida]
MELSVLNIEGRDTGRKIDLKDSVYGIEPNQHVVYLDVKRYLANNRQGTHKSKERSFVKGSTRKLRKQKGSGLARVGSIKSPIFRGGGRIFGPTPRDYSLKVNKNTKKIARKSVFTIKARENRIKVLEDFSFDVPKTKDFRSILKALDINKKKSLFILPTENKNIYLSSRNFKEANVITASDINTYSLLKASEIILIEGAISKIENILA